MTRYIPPRHPVEPERGVQRGEWLAIIIFAVVVLCVGLLYRFWL